MRRLPAPILPVVVVLALLLLLLESPLASASSRPGLAARRAPRASRPLFIGASPYYHHHRLAALTGASASSSSPRHMAATAAGAAAAARSPTALGAAAAADAEDDPWVFDVLFTGTGQSSSVPLLKHIIQPGTCAVCDDALKRPGSKNKRNNVSCAIIKRRKSTPPGQTPRCVLIDCGKTFREVILNLFPKHGLREVGALLLTHGHADAILGMDDLRDLQIYEQVDPGVRYTSGPINVFLHKETMDAVKLRFDYLTGKPVYLDEAKNILERPVSYLKFNIVDVNAEISPDDIPIRCFPVLHGGSYISLGFSIGAAGNEFVYISDVKVIPPDTMAYLKSLPRIKTLVLDSLKWDTDNFGHASLREVLPWVDELQPERVFLVGAGCGWGDHDKANEDLATKRGYPHVQLAFDGMFLEGFKLYD